MEDNAQRKTISETLYPYAEDQKNATTTYSKPQFSSGQSTQILFRSRTLAQLTTAALVNSRTFNQLTIVFRVHYNEKSKKV